MLILTFVFGFCCDCNFTLSAGLFYVNYIYKFLNTFYLADKPQPLMFLFQHAGHQSRNNLILMVSYILATDSDSDQ